MATEVQHPDGILLYILLHKYPPWLAILTWGDFVVFNYISCNYHRSSFFPTVHSSGYVTASILYYAQTPPPIIHNFSPAFKA